MTGFIINVSHWPNSKFVTVSGYGKHMRPDTFFCQYTVGKMKPNYPMPAIPTRVGYVERGMNEFKDLAYVYVSTDNHLWTFWKGLGLIEERR